MRRWRPRATLALLLGALLLGASLLGAALGPAGSPVVAAQGDVRIAAAEPTTFDPAAAGDSASAAVIAQLFETLTTFDASLAIRPALAESWRVDDNGLRVTFTLRPDLTFSDGSPLTAGDVVRSWLRVLDPAHPSPLASLLDEVSGAVAYRTGASTDPGSVGLRAPDDRTVEVDLASPADDFPAIVSSPTFGVVPPTMPSASGPAASGPAASDPTAMAVSGGYRVSATSSSEITLTANDRYWAGRPAIGTIHLITDLGGQSPVQLFQDGQLDYTTVAGTDATWIAYDRTLGPQLRSVPSMTVTYLGFDTQKPPFDDPRVRSAFAQAVDWKRLVQLTTDGETTPATSMVPVGVPGRSDQDFQPAYDPAAARASLAAAGFPGGAGFPAVTMLTPGTAYEEAIVKEIHDVLGVTIQPETTDFQTYFQRLETDPPAIWTLGWVADYPGSNDFLGLLLGSGRTANYGRWSSPAFDAAIRAALAAPDPAATRAAFDQAESIVQQDAPVVPIDYGSSWALSRDGLLGAGQNGMSIIRMAGLAWAP